MTYRDKKYGGLVRYDHDHKIIYLQRHMNPPSYEARFVNRLQENYPEYQIVRKK
jgi:hypothetical protein